jgi:outer membrane protein assembly factor BamB
VGSDDGRLYMVNLTDGKELWSYDIGQALTSSPAIVNGIVVIGSQDGNVYAFGTKTK